MALDYYAGFGIQTIKHNFWKYKWVYVGYDEKATKNSTKKMGQYSMILNFMSDKEWHKTSEIAGILGLKATRTKDLLKELVSLDKLMDNGKTKGKLYRLK